MAAAGRGYGQRTDVRARAALLLAIAVIGLSLAALAPSVHAGEKLQNTGFSGCVGPEWQHVGLTIDSCSSGTATFTATTTGMMFQPGPASGGAQYDASISATVSGAALVTLSVGFGNTAFFDAVMLENENAILHVSGMAPANASFFKFEVEIEPTGPATVTFENPSLFETLAPTSTPTNTATPTPTETHTATPPTSTAAPSGTASQPTAAPTSTAAATGTTTPSAGSTSTPTATRTPTQRSTPPGDSGTSSAVFPSLANGSFDAVADGVPSGWTKFGGVLYASSDVGRGGIAALASSTDSRKGVLQER